MILTSATMKDIGDAVKNRIPGMGFCVVVFPLNRPGNANYVSNANSEDMVEALRRAADNLEAKNATAAERLTLRPTH